MPAGLIIMMIKNMIDTRLIAKSVLPSDVFQEIDQSWHRYIDSIDHGTVVIPFSGSYNAIIKDKFILVEGLLDKLVIDRVCYGTTYLLKQPIYHKKFRLYGVYDKDKNFVCFTSIPQIGAHYMSLNMKIELCSICTGDLQYEIPRSLSALQECCQNILKSLRTIYLASIGVNVILPKKLSSLEEILDSRTTTAAQKLEQLKQKKFIKDLL